MNKYIVEMTVSITAKSPHDSYQKLHGLLETKVNAMHLTSIKKIGEDDKSKEINRKREGGMKNEK